jgi:hypothetical protein
MDDIKNLAEEIHGSQALAGEPALGEVIRSSLEKILAPIRSVR